MRWFIVGLAAASAVLVATAGQVHGGITLGGAVDDRVNLQTALDDLGESYTPGSEYPDPTGLGAGDIIIIGMDGGTGPYQDYTTFLNAGGDLICAGGSNWDPYRAWIAGYFNITDTASGWHTDGDWHKSSDHIANTYLPDDYTFETVGHTYHMLGFLATPNTTILGYNDEGIDIAAIREYNNGGTFNYMALDLGWRPGDQDAFITPWLHGALDAAREVVIPEPSTFLVWSLLAALGIGTAAYRRKR